MYPLFIAQMVLVLLAGVSTGIWTYYDASSRNAVYPGTIAAIVTVFVPTVLVYVYYRERIGPRTQQRSTVENMAGVFATGSLSAMVLGQLLAPPDPFGIGLKQLLLFPVGIAFGLVWMYQITPRMSEAV